MIDDTLAATLDDSGAQTLRRYWFTYLDTIEGVQPVLHSYCLALTGSLWDAEDLVQDTLLRGFAMTARGDFHGAASPVANPKAYLLRTATNLWLDIQRRRKWHAPAADAAEAGAAEPDADPVATADALGKAASLASPQEFASLLLKEVYGFTLEEVADFVGTTVGTVKSALSRARRKMRTDTAAKPVDARAAALVRAFVDAMNARDVDRVLGLMAETVKIDVCNVGGGRGRSGIWTEKSMAGLRFEYAEYESEPVALVFAEGDPALAGAVRLEGFDAVTRIVDYHYADDTLRHLAGALRLDCVPRGYHQPADVLPEMVATTALPWRNR